MVDREEGAVAPNQRQGQNQQQNQEPAGQQHLHITGLILSQNSQESQKKMQKCICYILMIG